MIHLRLAKLQPAAEAVLYQHQFQAILFEVFFVGSIDVPPGYVFCLREADLWTQQGQSKRKRTAQHSKAPTQRTRPIEMCFLVDLFNDVLELDSVEAANQSLR